LKERFVKNGGTLVSGVALTDIGLRGEREINEIGFKTENGEPHKIAVETVISTIPMKILHEMIRFEKDVEGPSPFDLRARSLRILFLSTKEKIAGDNETYYCPNPDYRIGRISEVGKYSPALNAHVTGSVLTLEIPCSEGDEIWSATDAELYRLCRAELKRLGIMKNGEDPEAVYFSKKIKDLYPIFEVGWRDKFKRLFDRLNAVENLFMIGRPALFLHCNIDHCILMALRLDDFLKTSRNKSDWASISESFLNFQVKD
jgi:protoporphyrinogen oxidase